jgi:tetratricopeptide (TPR) repeat protein
MATLALVDTLSRVPHLAWLCLGPTLASPDPDPSPRWFAAVGAALLAGGPLLGVALARRYENLEARVASAAWFLASIGLFFGARPVERPLLGSYYVSAPLLWIALAATAATLAGQHLGASFRNKRMGAAVVTLAVGIFTFRGASTLIANPLLQWRTTLEGSPAHERALAALEGALTAAPAELGAAAERCVAAVPNRCRCRIWRAELRRAANDLAGIGEELTAETCTTDSGLASRARTLRALGLVARGELERAEQEATTGLALRPDEPSTLYALALVRDRQGNAAEALSLASRAAKAGAGRDAELLELALLITKGDLAAARATAAGMVERRPDDGDAVYDLALVSDREGRFNEAREGYLKALRLKPNLRDARFNLALLTHRHGVVEESKHHLRKFVETWPDDPRGADLALRLGVVR